MALDPLNYKLVLRQILVLAGIDFNNLPTTEWNLVRDLASRRIKFAWESAKWPEVCVTEERTITQSGGDEGNYIALNQANETEIGSVFEVWNKSPKANTDLSSLTWYLSENGVQISESNTSAFIYFRKVPPQFLGDLYSQTTAYSSGDQVYDNTIGNFYTANQSVSSGSDNSPNAQPSFWDVVSVPAIFKDYLIRGTYADYLRHNQELDRARVAERDAQDVLNHELAKLQQQQGQLTSLEVESY
jgi:hypothetical protein